MGTNSSLAAVLCVSLALLTQRASAQVIFEDLHLVRGFAKAHGILMGLTFVVIVPFGALFIRFANFKGAVWVHAAWQIVGWILGIAGLAIGIRMAKIIDQLHNNTHTIFGTVIVAMLLVQPFIGAAHHWRYRATQRQNAVTHLHVWFGRALVILGMINGGLGLKFAGNTTGGTIAYGVVAGVVGVTYLIVAGGTEWKKVTRPAKGAQGTGTEEGSKGAA